jgi:PAS domain S-box-containing protein
VRADDALELYRELFEFAPEPYLVTDAPGVIEEANQAAVAFFGRPKAFLRRTPLPFFVAAADRRAFYDRLARLGVLRSGAESWEARLAVREGETAAVAFSVAVTAVEGGRAARLRWLLRDVTARRRAEEALQEAQRQALQLERLAAIGQVAASLAHESRNALQRANAALALLRWQLQGQEGLVELVGRVQAAQDDLLRLYEDVRGFAAPIALDVRPCRLDDVWRQAWAEVLERCPGRAAALAEDAAGVGLACEADPYRLGQVFRNLFDNALAACPQEARVAVCCRDEEVDGLPGVRVAVRDNGPGLGEEAKRRMFEAFYTTKTHGTGLGLAIVRRVVESHRGRVAAGDAPGGGAEVAFTLPRRRS